MNIGHEHKSSKDVLAAILGQNGRPRGGAPMSADDDAEDVADDASASAADDPFEGELQIIDAETPTGADDDQPAFLAADGAEDDTTTTESAERTPRRRQRATTATVTPRGGLVARIFGLLCLGTGIVTTVLDGRGQLPAGLQAIGFDSSILFVLGSIAWVLGAVRRQTALAQARITAIVQEQQETWTTVQHDLQVLLGRRPATDDSRPVAAGDELAQVLAALQRQDEKVNNLSRALKMYGKPLMEITNQGADVSAQVGNLKTQLEAALADVSERLQHAGTSQSQPIDLEPLEQQCADMQKELQRALAALGERLQPVPTLQQQLVRIEASVQALSQRLDDSEVRKSLLRLEDTTKHHGKAIAEAAKADALQQESQRLERHLDLAIGKVGAGVEQLRDRHLAPMENCVRELQRELNGLLTSVAYIQQSLKTGARAPTPAAATPAAGTTAPLAPPAAAPTAGDGPAAGAKPAATPVSRPATTSPPPGPNATADAAAGVEQNKTGARATTGKNVLGAIAKLKKMKG